jgi:surfeit locus 1 family protein
MKRWLLLAIAALATAGFIALGVWQVERRAWKLALIERVDQRIHATPVAAPGPAEWPGLTRESSEYRRVTATGRFLEGRQTLVRAVTELGEGFWLMEPLQTDEGFVVLVNRGFVPQGWRSDAPSSIRSTSRPDASSAPSVAAPQTAAKDAAAANPTQLAAHDADGASQLQLAAHSADAASQARVEARSTPSATEPLRDSAMGGTVSVTGLLRLSEPHGAFLRANAPAENRWYSRDVEAISHAQHLAGTAPYFIDAQAASGAGPDSSQPPVAGLTVVHFRNAHLQYALTWFVLALMAAALGVRVARTR